MFAEQVPGPPEGNESATAEFWRHTLPGIECSGCHRWIPRRRHRVVLRATWRDANEHLCPACWSTICDWAARFALVQMPLGPFDYAGTAFLRLAVRLAECERGNPKGRLDELEQTHEDQLDEAEDD